MVNAYVAFDITGFISHFRHMFKLLTCIALQILQIEVIISSVRLKYRRGLTSFLKILLLFLRLLPPEYSKHVELSYSQLLGFRKGHSKAMCSVSLPGDYPFCRFEYSSTPFNTIFDLLNFRSYHLLLFTPTLFPSTTYNHLHRHQQ